jgi:hypothetical protein
MTIPSNMLLQQPKSGDIFEQATATVLSQQNCLFKVTNSYWPVIPIHEISDTVIVFDFPLRQHYDLVSGKPVFHTLFQILKLNGLISWEPESIRPLFHQSVRSGTIGYFL